MTRRAVFELAQQHRDVLHAMTELARVFGKFDGAAITTRDGQQASYNMPQGRGPRVVYRANIKQEDCAENGQIYHNKDCAHKPIGTRVHKRP